LAHHARHFLEFVLRIQHQRLTVMLDRQHELALAMLLEDRTIQGRDREATLGVQYHLVQADQQHARLSEGNSPALWSRRPHKATAPPPWSHQPPHHPTLLYF